MGGGGAGTLLPQYLHLQVDAPAGGRNWCSQGAISAAIVACQWHRFLPLVGSTKLNCGGGDGWCHTWHNCGA